jgi:membrane-associated protein
LASGSSPAGYPPMHILSFLIDFVLHIDQHLPPLIAAYGPWIYLLLFIIIFSETK